MVGLKIPVHVMSEQGWNIIKNHLRLMNEEDDFDYESIELTTGEEKSIFANSKSGVKVLKKKDIHGCIDCPHPCI